MPICLQMGPLQCLEQIFFVAMFYRRLIYWLDLTNSCCLEIYACAMTQVQKPATKIQHMKNPSYTASSDALSAY